MAGIRDRGNRAAGGQALVETALLLPFIIVMIFALIDFGYYFFTRTTVNHATREAARYAALNNKTLSQIIHKLQTTAAGSPVSQSAITVQTCTFDPEYTPARPTVTITVSYDHEFLTPLVYTGLTSLPVYAQAKQVVTTYSSVPCISFNGTTPPASGCGDCN